MKNKITEAQLRQMIEEGVKNALNESISNTNREEVQLEVANMLYTYIKEKVDNNIITFDDKLRLAWRKISQEFAEAVYKAKQRNDWDSINVKI